MSDQEIRARAQAAFARNLEYIEAEKIREWVDLFTPDGVLEFAYSPKDVPSRFTGHDALYEHMKHFPELLQVRFADLVFHDTVDPELVIAEFRADGKAVPTGRDFHQTYISVVRTSDGKFVHFKDFWNPLPVIEALGMDTIEQIDAA
ncbi:nuclear transport factor 2 family protein [Micromonospora sp. NPDC049645]|uniref:nuclear transport factor 2 family protein n=1 Tax=Micromonospora sp. NPDC049645 TaxID=3155508 RepID=UPI003418DACC